MSRLITNGPDKEMKNAREVRETILTLHEDELDNALWINDLHIVPMTREAEPEIPHEVGAGQLEMFLDLVIPAGRRRPSPAPERDGPRLHHRHRTQLRRPL
jgi:hypothetical protein